MTKTSNSCCLRTAWYVARSIAVSHMQATVKPTASPLANVPARNAPICRKAGFQATRRSNQDCERSTLASSGRYELCNRLCSSRDENCTLNFHVPKRIGRSGVPSICDAGSKPTLSANSRPNNTSLMCLTSQMPCLSRFCNFSKSPLISLSSASFASDRSFAVSTP